MTLTNPQMGILQDMCVFDIIAMNDLEAGDVHGAF